MTTKLWWKLRASPRHRDLQIQNMRLSTLAIGSWRDFIIHSRFVPLYFWTGPLCCTPHTYLTRTFVKMILSKILNIHAQNHLAHEICQRKFSRLKGAELFVFHLIQCGDLGDKIFKARLLKADNGGCQEVFCRRIETLRAQTFRDVSRPWHRLI